MLQRFFIDVPSWPSVLLAVVPIVVLAWLASRIARRAVHALLTRVLRDTVAVTSPLLRAPLRLIGFIAFFLVFAVLIGPAFELAGIHPRAGVHLQTLAGWTFDSGLRVLLIVAIAYATIRLMSVGVKRFEHDVSFGTGLDALERAKRARTLGTVLTHITSTLVLGITTLMVLREFHVDISPVLTGAGIVGVALGFGAQTLVRDLIGGFFLLLENQIRVGDTVAINGIGGLVETINLRTTLLRDEEGAIHVIPNGSISSLANRSKDFSYYVINLPLAFGEDTDMIGRLIKNIADELIEEDRYKPFVLAPLEVIGIDSFDEGGVRLKMRIKTAPQKQWDLGRELRRRIMRALSERGIQMFSAQRQISLPPPLNTPRSSAPPSAPGTPERS
jgi:small-conductance mechanosensitive channel